MHVEARRGYRKRMPTLTTYRPLPPLTAADLFYIRDGFVALEDVSPHSALLTRWILEGRLPRPAYVLDDGTSMVARDYLALHDAAGSVEALASHFAGRYRAAAGDVGDAVVEDAWQAYLSGEFAVCLRSVTPETIVRKERLVEVLTQQLAAPAPRDPSWCRALRERVTELDSLTRRFAPCDRARFGGSVSRDRVIDAPRRDYPQAFASPRLESFPS